MPGPLDSTFFLDARVLKYSTAGMPFTPICPRVSGLNLSVDSTRAGFTGIR